MHWRMGAEQPYISPHVVVFLGGGGQLLLHHSTALASCCCTTPSSSFLTTLKAWPVLVHFLLVPRRWFVLLVAGHHNVPSTLQDSWDQPFACCCLDKSRPSSSIGAQLLQARLMRREGA